MATRRRQETTHGNSGVGIQGTPYLFLISVYEKT